MSDTPRFTDEQVRLILHRAAADGVLRSDLPADGRSLADVEQVAAEAGISIQAVRRAAAVVASSTAEPLEVMQRSLGIPTAVARRLRIGRGVSSAAWARTLARLRIVCDARGSQREDAVLREWRHRALRVVVERAAGGDVVHLSAREEGPLLLPAIGGGLAAFGLALVAFFLQIPPTEQARMLWVLGAFVSAIGGVIGTSGLLMLRRWAAEHIRLLDQLAEELPTLLRDDDVGG